MRIGREPRFTQHAVAGRVVVVEGDDADARGAEALLRARGADVRRGGDPARAEILVCDVWTPDVAPHVVAARRRGALVTTLADIVLEECGCRVIAVTGTAGKTTVSRLVEAMLDRSGVRIHVARSGRAGQAWPNHELLAIEADPADWIVAELTSSHLAFMRPPRADIAVVTCFWPDHVELHGSAEAYLAAKLAVVRGQGPGDVLVVDASDPTLQPFLMASAATVIDIGEPRGDEPGPLNARIAAVTARAAGATEGAIRVVLAAPHGLPHRCRYVGAIGGVDLYDDSMAATPRKAIASIRAFTGRGLVLLVGGNDRPATGPVHASPEECAALREALGEASDLARTVIAFGPAAGRVREVVPGCRVAVDLDAAMGEGLALTRPGDALVLAPMFPLSMAERERFAALAASL